MKLMESERIADQQSLDQSNEALLDKAEALIWALLDDEIQPADIRELETLLKENADVRDRYVTCVQLHFDLQQHFGDAPAPPATAELPKSPVLGFLGDIRSGSDSLPPVLE